MRIVSIVAIVGALCARVAGAAPCTDLTTIRQNAETACPCAGQSSAKAYKQCVKTKLKSDGIKGSCKKQMMATAAKSICGKSGFVVCCAAGKKGKVVKTAKCKGTACTSGPGGGFSLFPLTGADCSAAGDCPTTTTSSTSTTTVTPTTDVPTTTSTTLPNLCKDGFPDGTLDAGEECDDNDLDPTDGCTRECTICGNGTITPPELCDDSNLVSGDGCDANCQPTGCGNGLIVGLETCDDGNTSDADSCPSDCIVDPCTPNSGTDAPASVTVAGNDNIAAVRVLVDYPEGKVSILGSGGSIPAGIITDNPGLSSVTPNDYDHALQALVQDTSGSTILGLLFKIHFESCNGASAITAGDFTCTVIDAADPNGSIIPSGVTCAVTVP
jgi:cysteine-rich repeat protein